MDKKPYPSDAADKFVLRLPEGMRERIAEFAKQAGRSMNAEIVARISESYTTQLRSEINTLDLTLKDHLIWDLIAETIQIRGDLLMLAMQVEQMGQHGSRELLVERCRDIGELARWSAGRIRLDFTRSIPGMTEHHKEVVAEALSTVRETVERRAKLYGIPVDQALAETDRAFRGMSVLKDEYGTPDAPKEPARETAAPRGRRA